MLCSAPLTAQTPFEQRVAGVGLALPGQACGAENLTLALLSLKRLLGLIDRPFKLALILGQLMQMRLGRLPCTDRKPCAARAIKLLGLAR